MVFFLHGVFYMVFWTLQQAWMQVSCFEYQHHMQHLKTITLVKTSHGLLL